MNKSNERNDMPTKQFIFETMAQLKSAKKLMGPGFGEFFRRGYKIHTDLLPGGYFVSSLVHIDNSPDGPVEVYEQFVVRQVNPDDCRILIISSGHKTLEQATDSIAKVAGV